MGDGYLYREETKEAHPYEGRLRRVIQYIFDNPAGDLSLDAPADLVTEIHVPLADA